MKNWGIKKRVLFVALLPTILIAISIASYFSYTQIINLENSLHERGRLITDQLANASEYAVFSSNIDILEQIFNKTLDDMNDIIEISVTDTSDTLLITKHNPHIQLKSDSNANHIYSFISDLIKEDTIKFHAAIKTTEIEINDYNESFETHKNNSASNIIGHISLTLSNRTTREKQLTSLIKGAYITFFGLLISTILAIRMSTGVIKPIKRLTKAMDDIANNRLDTRLSIDSGGEIGSLEQGLNSMADEIQSVRQNLEKEVKQATASLTQTLDELEIQNIELDIARNHALSASKIKSEFLANMSHEIRTPMNGVIGFTDLLSKTKIDSQQSDYIKTIENSARNLLTIIDDILDFSKIESGKLRIENIGFDLTEVLNSIITMFTPMAYNKNIEIVNHPLPDKIPNHLIGDPTRLRQILVNLISNAIKFTSNGHVSIKLEIIEQTHDNIHIKFIIQDTGIGLDNINKQQLFKAFTQADSSISRRFGGTGLGLVICKNLTELMHGDIDFESSPEQGSTFWCSIKFEIVPTDNNDTLAINCTDKTVLIYEDYLENINATLGLVTKLGPKTLTITDHNAIEDITRQNKIDLVIIGISRSKLKNNDFISEISKIAKTLPVKFLTIISTFSENDLKNIQSTGLKNTIFRSSPESLIANAISNIMQGKATINTHGTHDLRRTVKRNFNHIKALVVDDNDINLKLAKTILENSLIQVSMATNGKDALDLCSSGYFDIILMDLHMPIMNGFKTIEAIRSTNNPCKKSIIVALTANASPEDKQNAFNVGVNDILIKPFSENQIFTIFEQWLLANANAKSDHSQPSGTETSTSPYNQTAAIELTGGNKSLADELLAMLVLDLPNQKKLIEKIYLSNNLEELRHVVHKLHGGAKYCAAEDLSSSAGKLEDIIIKKDKLHLESAINLVYDNIEKLISYYNEMSK